MPKVIAVVGGKHSGKTTVIKYLISELRRRGYRVGSMKDMSRVHWVDLPGKDTWEHGVSGAEMVIATPLNETVCFIKKKLNLNEALNFFHAFDFVILEGFEKEKTLPKIIAAKDSEEVATFYDSLVIAISGIIAESDKEMKKASIMNVPIFNCKTEAGKLADIVEQKAFQKFPGKLHCGECGYSSCYEFAKAVVAGKETSKTCPLLTREDVVVEVNGNRIPLKSFPRVIIRNIVVGAISSLYSVGEIKELKIVVKGR